MANRAPGQTDPMVVPTGPEDQSIGALMGRVSSDTAELFRKELELAKVEIKEEITKAGKGAGMFGGGAFCGYLAILMAAFAAAWAIAEVIAVGWAFLCISVLFTLAAGVFFVMGRKEMKQVHGPQQTVETLKEDAQWARELRN